MRGLLGIVAGLLAAIVIAMLVSFLGGLVVGAPAIDMSNAAAIREAYSSLSIGQQLLGLVAWAVGALAGAYVAKRISGRSWAAWTVAGLITVYQLLSIALLPMPTYMQVLAIVLPIAGGFIANKMVAERTLVEDREQVVRSDAEV